MGRDEEAGEKQCTEQGQQGNKDNKATRITSTSTRTRTRKTTARERRSLAGQIILRS